MSKIFSLFSLFLLLAGWVSVGAEYYRYVDKNGTVVFTDDIIRIPENDRARAEIRKDRPSNSGPVSRPVIEMREEEELNRWLKRYFEENYGSNESLPPETDMELVF